MLAELQMVETLINVYTVCLGVFVCQPILGKYDITMKAGNRNLTNRESVHTPSLVHSLEYRILLAQSSLQYHSHILLLLI